MSHEILLSALCLTDLFPPFDCSALSSLHIETETGHPEIYGSVLHSLSLILTEDYHAVCISVVETNRREAGANDP